MGGMVRTEAGLKELEDRVEQNPNDPNALVMLARSYVEQERYVDAVKTYEKLVKIIPNEAVLWADYADAMAMTHQSLIGPATKLLEQALALNPNEPKALALSGTAAMERGDYPAAVRLLGEAAQADSCRVLRMPRWSKKVFRRPAR